MRARVTLFTIALASASMAFGGTRPYAGQEQRSVKALSEQKISGYLSGAGMGYAKAAELNHYPWPKHVLELADELDLTEEQRRATVALVQGVKTGASKLGEAIVEAERTLDAAFAGAAITSAELDHQLGEIAGLEARLRGVHLKAHLAMRRLMTDEQVAHYDELRGYAAR